MFQEFLGLMPKETSRAGFILMIVVGACGLALWAAGARFNRMFTTLTTVALGGWLGMMAPRWMAWDVNTMATSLSIAMVFGASGFIAPRMWMGIALMILLAAWAAAGTWVAAHGDTKLVWPAECETLRDFGGALWTGLPEAVKGPLPMAALLAAGVGLGLSVLWPRVATVLFYSGTGLTALLAAGLSALASNKLDWPPFLPNRTLMQFVMLAGLLVLGAMVQWHWMPIKRKRPEAQGSQESGGKVQASAR